MRKPDGTSLVHQSTNRDPVNCQPPGCRRTAELDEDDTTDDATLLARSERSTLHIRFETVNQVPSLSLTHEQDLDLVGSEEDLRQRNLADPDIVEEGFQPRATERETDAGTVDLYGTDAEGSPRER